LDREKYTLFYPGKLLWRPLSTRKPLAHALSTIIFPFRITLSAQLASLVENKRIDGSVVQYRKACLGPVTEEQIPYLKATYAKKKSRLVYD
jgi:hypothetical protein